MRFATLNTWGRRGDWTSRLPLLRNGFTALDADIVVLQETVLTADVDQVAEMLGTGYHPGRHVIDNVSVCYRSAWESTHPAERLATYIPENPLSVDADWPFRGIDHVLIRCGRNGPTLPIRECHRTFDHGPTSASDHYGLVVDFGLSTDPSS
ncbi:MAG TPA: hypothetical protein VHW44_29855 [Pseudonocardiaceae bacterium]|jgi:endonuclease/exonuclease/phosphatase family metal-dependent hydrolase|nr:hypothetical protein [Pseudonocardiaceae bacterium]